MGGKNMKKICIILVLIFALIIISLFIIIHNYNYQTINDGLATITKEEINEFNLKLEKFYGINSSEDIKLFLQQCINNYIDYTEEPVKVPLIIFVTDEKKVVLEHDIDKDFYVKEQDAEYYIGLNNILENILDDKTYKVEFKYSTKIIDGVSLIGEIDITEVDEKPEKFDLKELEKNRVYVEEEVKNNANYKREYTNSYYVVTNTIENDN